MQLMTISKNNVVFASDLKCTRGFAGLLNLKGLDLNPKVLGFIRVECC